MTDNEIELINLIRENDNPEEAIITATAIILEYLESQNKTLVVTSTVNQSYAS